MIVEVIVQTVDDARAADAGGADRLEVVRDIVRDGLTPSLEVVRAIQAVSRLPLRVMVRERASFEISEPGELDALRRAAAGFADLGVDGLVLGFTRDQAVDLRSTRAVLDGLAAVPVTFHRAFDTLSDPLDALDALRALPQIDRVLTCGSGADWVARCDVFRGYAARAGDGLTILAGAGIDDDALRVIAANGAVREVHVGRAAREQHARNAPVSAGRVRALRAIADSSR